MRSITCTKVSLSPFFAILIGSAVHAEVQTCVDVSSSACVIGDLMEFTRDKGLAGEINIQKFVTASATQDGRPTVIYHYKLEMSEPVAENLWADEWKRLEPDLKADLASAPCSYGHHGMRPFEYHFINAGGFLDLRVFVDWDDDQSYEAKVFVAVDKCER